MTGRIGLACGAMPEGRCLAGFSGGADSTALMYLLAEAMREGRTQPEAVHVNHGIRGAEADGDEAFCRRVCEELGIPFHGARAELHGRTDENACREARFRAFRETMEATGIRQLVLAHNRDDLAETFLMRLMRGAGTEGLACMSPKDARDGYTILRPMLENGRAEIREALKAAGIPWREDSTNANEGYLRNSVRGKLIPLMEQMSPGAAGRIAAAAGILTAENGELQRQADEFLARHSRGEWLDADALREEPDALRGRILRSWWKRNAPELDEHTLSARQTAELLQAAGEARATVNLPGGTRAVKARNGIYITGLREKNTDEVPYGPGEIRFGGVTLKTVPPQGNPGDGKRSQEMPENFPADGCVIRTRRDGDRIRPFGMSGSRKLQDYLTDRGIDEPWRDRIPLLCRGNEVIMAAGVGTGAVPKWKPEERNIRLEWTGELPWEKREGDKPGDEPEQ